MKKAIRQGIIERPMKGIQEQVIFRLNYKAGKGKMQDIYKPFERPERSVEPPKKPTIPEGISGWYDARNDEFIADDEAFEEALENWDLMTCQKQQKFKRFLIDLYFEDWQRIRGD